MPWPPPPSMRANGPRRGTALQPLLAKNPDRRICALMARIEGGEKRDAGRVREWLARAVRAPRDQSGWRMASSPMSGGRSLRSPARSDAFEWRCRLISPGGSAGDASVRRGFGPQPGTGTVARKINKAKAPEDETKPVVSDPEAGGPITITIKAEESSVSPLPVKPQPPQPVEQPAKPVAPAPTAAEAEVVAVSPAPAAKPDAVAPEATAKQESRSSARSDAGEAATGSAEITERPPRSGFGTTPRKEGASGDLHSGSPA